MDFKTKIVSYKNERNISTVALAKAFGVSRKMIYKYYDGSKPSYQKALLLVKIVPELTMKDCGY